MTAGTAPLSGDVGRASAGMARWAPGRIGKGADAVRIERLGQEVGNLVDKFVQDELVIAGSCRAAVSETGEMVALAVSVDGFGHPLTCRLPQSDAIAICASAHGAGPDAGPADATISPICRHFSIQFMESLIDCFCDVASSMSGRPIKRGDRYVKRGADREFERLSILVETQAATVEFEAARRDIDDIMQAVAFREQAPAMDRADLAQEMLRAEVARCSVRAEAVLDDRHTSLSELRTWQVGSTVRLQSCPLSTASLLVNGKAMFKCEIVQDGGMFAMRVLERFDDQARAVSND